MATAARRIEAMSERTSALLAASYAVPDLVVAVQEAVYNAIDARARHVVVVVDAAQASFTVEDDGDGIHPDEMFEHVFERNVSSKSDASAKKYGSRGRYLAALGTLAKQVELESRVENHWTSFRKVVQDGKIVFNARSKTNKTTKGTSLRVQNVFQWLPVRKGELEARASARTRLAKRLSAFFQSISMIWPMLSIDVSFPDAKVPRCVIPGASSCEERLRGVFGDILGGELEYAAFDDGDLPFTIRGYVGVVRDAGDGDAYLESPGWRQARAYYQYIFLDNFWLEEFQRECCKTINNAAIQLELGIPIFVVKISAKSLEYELYSDGETRVVNLKRPEVLTQTLCKFVEALKARVIEADASIEAMSSSLDEEGKATEPGLFEETYAVDNAAYASHMTAVYGEETLGYGDGMSSRSNQDGVDADDERETLQEYHDGESYFFEVADHSQEGGDDRYDYTPHESIDRRMYDREHTNGWATPTTMISEELVFAAEYEEPATMMMLDEFYEDDVSTAGPFSQYQGCAHCGSCERSEVSRSSTQNQHFVVYEPPMHSHPSAVVYEYFPPQSYEYEYGYEYGFEYLQPAESMAASRQAMHHVHQGEYTEYEPDAALRSIESGSDGLEHEPSNSHEHTARLQDSRAQTTAQVKQQRKLDQLFFGQSIPRSRQSRRRQDGVVSKRERATMTDTEQWVSSRRVGVVDFDDYSLDPTESKAAAPSQNHQTQSMAAKSDQRLEMDKCDQDDDKDTYLGSDQLSDYFSLEKLVTTHPRSLGSAIARFASKRTALTNPEGAAADGDRPRGVYVRKLPSDLHAPDAKIMTLDKAMLQDLQVIKQVDRKFILVKATLGSTVVAPHAEGDVGLSESTRTLLLCIDQHAADERVRLEQFELQVFGTNGDERNVQVVDHEPALAVSLNDRERDTLNLFADEIQSWGFHIASSEARVAHLTQTPRVDTRVANAEDFREYLQLLARSDAIVARRVVRPPAITRFLHSRACRSAIMFGDYLSFSQCEDIVEQLRHCNLPFQCAHGRPSIVPLVELM